MVWIYDFGKYGLEICVVVGFDFCSFGMVI